MTDESIELGQFRHEVLKILTYRSESIEFGFDQDPPTVSESRFWTKYRLFEVMSTVGRSSWSVEISHGDLCVCVSWNKERPTHLTICNPSGSTLELEGWDLSFQEAVVERIASYFFEGVTTYE